MPNFKGFRENPILLALIYAAGYTLGEDQNGEYVATQAGARGPAIVAAVQAIIDDFEDNLLPSSLAATLAAKETEIDAYAAERRNAAVEALQPHASVPEMISWPIKAAQAAKWLESGDDADAPLIVAEAQARQASVESVAQRVAGNAGALQQMEAQIAGNSGRHKDIIRAIANQATVTAADVQTIASYPFADGWPA